ncbi:hypothetical protein EYF80_060085 [Liparis tanakae]|uniref:Uncharacterized protein n=1 Tax=Liparis tanakae TaxID=230148 RepID=A0A4Z2ELJ6_9TELE|nr:hypothetical protein EYF80_060085 [Liparis tanakae]
MTAHANNPESLNQCLTGGCQEPAKNNHNTQRRGATKTSSQFTRTTRTAGRRGLNQPARTNSTGVDPDRRDNRDAGSPVKCYNHRTCKLRLRPLSGLLLTASHQSVTTPHHHLHPPSVSLLTLYCWRSEIETA